MISPDQFHHTLVECLAGLCAFVTGFVLYRRSQTKRFSWAFPIGVAYLSVALMDVVHGVSSSGFIEGFDSHHVDLDRYVPGTWWFSRVFLAVGFYASYQRWKMNGHALPYRVQQIMLAIAVPSGLTLTGLALSSSLPQSMFESFPHRPYDLILLPIYLWLAWRYRRSFPLCASLVCDGAVQLSMQFSGKVFDGPFFVAHWLKFTAYLWVLVWLEADAPKMEEHRKD